MSCGCKNKCNGSCNQGGCIDIAGLNQLVISLSRSQAKLEDLFNAEEIAKLLAELCCEDVKGCTSIDDLRNCLLKEFRKAKKTWPGEKSEILVRTFEDTDECHTGEPKTKILNPDLVEDDEFIQLAAWTKDCPTACDIEPVPQLRKVDICHTPPLQPSDTIKAAGILERTRTCPSGAVQTECRIVPLPCQEKHGLLENAGRAGICLNVPVGTSNYEFTNPPDIDGALSIMDITLTNPTDCPAFYELPGQWYCNRAGTLTATANVAMFLIEEGTDISNILTILNSAEAQVVTTNVPTTPKENIVFGQLNLFGVNEAFGIHARTRILQPGESVKYTFRAFGYWDNPTANVEIWHLYVSLAPIFYHEAFLMT